AWRSLMGIALASAHVVRGPSGHRRHEHPAQRLADLVGVGVVEKRDPLAADLVAARYDRLGEDVNETRHVGLVWQAVIEMKAGRAEGPAHTLGVDEVAGHRVADPQLAS